MEIHSRFSDGTIVPDDGEYHVDPLNPMISIRSISDPKRPPGVIEIIGGGSTSSLGRMANGSVMKFSLPGDKSSVRGLEVEDTILRTLGTHDRLVQYLGKTDDGLLFERALHGDSKEFMLASPQQTSDRSVARRWSIQAAEAVTYVHAKGVIHCDLHPRNFLVTDQLDLQLCDFAGSRYGDLDGYGLEDAAFCLPRDYTKPSSIQSDLFALGSVIYYFSTGLKPYHDRADDEISSLYALGEFPSVPPTLLGELIVRCWTGEFKSACDVHKALTEMAAAAWTIAN